MIILGLDPGTARVGWGIIQSGRNTWHAVAYGLIETDKTLLPEERLADIYASVLTLLNRYKPDAISIEDLYFATNAKTAIAVGQARGVLLLACGSIKKPIASYSPLAVKRTITGDGKADKQQVQYMVTKLFHLTETPKPDDVADALAIALTHAYTYKMKEACV